MSDTPTTAGWGWAGTAAAFLSTTPQAWTAALTRHHNGLMLSPPSAGQRTAWQHEHRVVTGALREAVFADERARHGGVVFEYELPLEGGRRPDVVVLAGETIAVLEFKQAAAVTISAIDQVEAYARDLADYHRDSHGREVRPFLVLPSATSFDATYGDVVATSGDGLGHYLHDVATQGTIDLQTWLQSPYEPLPQLVEAARRIFNHEPLPHVRRAIAAGIPRTVDLLATLCERAEAEGWRLLALLTGVPGSGKTLVGLRVVYERTGRADATFLSGNGPLVTVLQDALRSRVFVRDLHAFIRTHGINQRDATQHIIVFDEAQRAWDQAYMQEKRGIGKSEPQLLVEVGERLPGWASLVGLIGGGQEIHAGEEAGLAQWRDAISPPQAQEHWKLHCPPRLQERFDGLDVTVHEELGLDVTLRSRRAEHLHEWVALLLGGEISAARRQGRAIERYGYPMYVTRSLDAAREYARHRFVDEPAKRYGLVASSHSQVLPSYGVDTSYMATNRVLNIARWYNGASDDPRSSTALTQSVTEFGCQGLELDLPIVCWGEDLRWEAEQWHLKPIRRRYPQVDPRQLLQNAYRVLLTRGRDGMVIFLPPEAQLNATETALLAAGVNPLPSGAELAAAAEEGGEYVP